MHRRNAQSARFRSSIFRKLAALTVSLVVAATASHAAAQAAGDAHALLERTPDLFGSTALLVRHSAFDGRWASVADDRPALTGAAQQLMQTVRSRPALEQLQRVNAWVNHAVAYTPDPPGEDNWATLSQTLRTGRGDCEDYAIAKMELLKAAGVPAQDLYLLIVHDLVKRADHAILAVQVDGQFWILDLGTDEVLPQRAVHDYRPIMSFNAGHAWIHGFGGQLDVASVASPVIAR
ncbi:MAG TPA: transglutaminase-like cysteine peptidase [Caulobacteraceae bacterium]|jgi:predicted transglutaminase-like cysteine proteinase